MWRWLASSLAFGLGLEGVYLARFDSGTSLDFVADEDPVMGLAWILFLEGDYKNAYKYSSLAYAKDQDPEIIQHYYMILLKNGLKDEAGNIIKKSVEENPTNSILLKLLKKHKDELSKL